MEKNQEVRKGINGRLITGKSAKTGNEYTAFQIYYLKANGDELQIKQVFLTDLELEMLKILES